MEANMKWTIGKRFLEKKDTFASKTLATLFKDTSLIKAKLVGLEILEGPPARGGESIISKEGIEFGSVTSGTYSPTLGKFIAIARVQKDKMFGSIIGQKVSVVIRDQQYEATICKLPFITHTYTK